MYEMQYLNLAPSTPGPFITPGLPFPLHSGSQSALHRFDDLFICMVLGESLYIHRYYIIAFIGLSCFFEGWPVRLGWIAAHNTEDTEVSSLIVA